MRAAAALAAVLTVALLLAACGPSQPEPPAGRRTWRGPSDTVVSEGTTSYERRELAQKVLFPACVTIGAAAFRYAGVQPVPSGDPTPAGLLDTGYGLDRWRLLAPAGALEEQQRVFVTVLGSTGIVGQYPRLPVGRGC